MRTLRSNSRKRSPSPPDVPRVATVSPASNSKRDNRSPREIAALIADAAVTALPLDPVTPAGHGEHAVSFASMRRQKREVVRTRESLNKRKVLFAEEEKEQQDVGEEAEEAGEEEAEEPVGELVIRKRVRRGSGAKRGGEEAFLASDGAMEEEGKVLQKGKRKIVEEVSEGSEEEGNGMTDEVAIVEKGKRKLVEISSDSEIEENPLSPAADYSSEAEERIGRNGSSLGDAGGAASSHAARGSGPSSGPRQRGPIDPDRKTAMKAKFLEVAKRRAAHFARYEPVRSSPVRGDAASEQGADEQKKRAAELLAVASAGARRPDNADGENQWHGPFVIARELVEGREAAAAARQETSRGAEAQRKSSVEWVPSRKAGFRKQRFASSLHDMCVEVLCANIEHVQSLFGMTDSAKKVIAASLCANRKVTPDTVHLYFSSEPAEIVLPDCTSVTEEILTEALAKCDTQKIEHLELGLCGRAMSDQLCTSALASFTLPLLHTLFLNGAYRLTDIGLKALVEVTPNLRTLNLKECSNISAAGLEAVANSVGGTLKFLSVQSCSQLKALQILPPILKMSNLESLCLSGLDDVSDGIISELAVILGPRLQELSVAHCKALTDVAFKAISLCCGGLKLLDMGHLPLLTDAAIESLADGCRSLRSLRLDRGKFSDKTLASLITASGHCLIELSLDSVWQTGDLTVSALSKYSKGTLRELDLSFCREVSDEALGLLADKCENLHEIRLFGCSQITNVFVEGHSNPVLNVIGLKNCVLDVSFSALLAKERSKTQFRG